MHGQSFVFLSFSLLDTIKCPPLELISVITRLNHSLQDYADIQYRRRHRPRRRGDMLSLHNLRSSSNTPETSRRSDSTGLEKQSLKDSYKNLLINRIIQRLCIQCSLGHFRSVLTHYSMYNKQLLFIAAHLLYLHNLRI